MVIDDLRSFPDSPLIVAEESVLPASAVSSGLADRSRAVWLLPTDDFHGCEWPLPGSRPDSAGPPGAAGVVAAD